MLGAARACTCLGRLHRLALLREPPLPRRWSLSHRRRCQEPSPVWAMPRVLRAPSHSGAPARSSAIPPRFRPTATLRSMKTRPARTSPSAGCRASIRSTRPRSGHSASTGCCSPRSTSGVGLLDRARHLHGPQLRRLLRRADAVQRHQRADHDVGVGKRLLPLRPPPGLLRPHDRQAILRSTTTSTRSWPPRTCSRPTAPARN